MKHPTSIARRLLGTLLCAFALTLMLDGVVARAHECLGTGADMDAEGKATARVRSSKGKLKINTRNLDALSGFSVTVDGVQIGSLATNSGGRGRARFSSRPRNQDQFLGVDPRGTRVGISDEEGEDVLECEIPEDEDDDPAAIRCCLPHEGGFECEDFISEHCIAEGGTDAGPGSCFPDPCEDGDPDPEVVRCCFPHEDGAQCLELGAELCSHEGGISLGAGSCDPNPCPPPTNESVRCCLEHEGEASCLNLTEEHCINEGGTSLGPDGSCSPNPCPQPPPPPRCCLVIEGVPRCEDFTAEHCVAEGGTAIEPGSCEPNPCG